MNRTKIIAGFNGGKFADAFGLDSLYGEFYVKTDDNGTKWLYYPESIPDGINLESYKRTAADIANTIDVGTGKRINEAVHPLCGEHETDGIIRNALVVLFNGLGIEAPADLAAWNSIAIAEIEKARIEKEALSEDD